MKHSYYIPNQEFYYGDEELKEELKQIYVKEISKKENYNEEYKHGHYDGVSRYEIDGKEKTVIVIDGVVKNCNLM